MPYSGTIDPATPAFDGDAGQGDDQLRALKRDILERLNSFFVDANADPLVPKEGDLGLAIDVKILHNLFAPRDNTTSFSRGTSAISPNSHAQSVFYGSMSFPAGTHITTARCKFSAAVGSNASVNIDIFRVFEGGGPTLLGNIATSGSGSGVQTVAVDITRDVVAGDIYTFVVTLNTLVSPNVNDAQFYWAQITSE